MTPFLSMIQAAHYAQDYLDIRLLCSNKRKKDILCHDLLTQISKDCPWLKVYHTLTQHDDEVDGTWRGFRGRVTMDMLKKCDFPLPRHDDG